MKLNRSSLWLCLGLFVLMAACTRPFSQPPTPFLFPTADLTLTAIYSVLTPSAPAPQATAAPTQGINNPADGGAATATLAPVFPTATSVPPSPTATSLPPTNTPVPPTATSVPPTATATPVPLLVHPKGQIAAYHFASPPTLDGDLSEWSNAKTFPVHSIVFGKDNWFNNADLQGNVQVGWDANNLYIAIKVSDDLYVQIARGEDIYKGDSLEILMDTNLQSDFYVKSLSADDYQLGISPGLHTPGNRPESYLWFPASLAGARTVNLFAGAISGGYVVEAAIPWNIFNVTPQAGTHYGFAVSVSDNDRDGQVVQDSMASSVPTRSLVNPTTWGDLYLNK